MRARHYYYCVYACKRVSVCVRAHARECAGTSVSVCVRAPVRARECVCAHARERQTLLLFCVWVHARVCARARA